MGVSASTQVPHPLEESSQTLGHDSPFHSKPRRPMVVSMQLELPSAPLQGQLGDDCRGTRAREDSVA